MPREMSGGTKVMVKVILAFFLFPAIAEIINLVLGWALLLPLHLLPKAWQQALAPGVTGYAGRQHRLRLPGGAPVLAQDDRGL
jgi:hypothetical protein